MSAVQPPPPPAPGPRRPPGFRDRFWWWWDSAGRVKKALVWVGVAFVALSVLDGIRPLADVEPATAPTVEPMPVVSVDEPDTPLALDLTAAEVPTSEAVATPGPTLVAPALPEGAPADAEPLRPPEEAVAAEPELRPEPPEEPVAVEPELQPAPPDEPVVAEREAVLQPEPAPGADCHSSYRGACVPITSDVDCIGGSGNGPEYVGTVEVVGPDEYGLDHDNDGIGCEDS